MINAPHKQQNAMMAKVNVIAIAKASNPAQLGLTFFGRQQATKSTTNIAAKM
jgi:hypothetical protein